MVVEKKQAENPLESARLIQMLQTLTKKESKSFVLFLASPYHNSIEAIHKFYQILVGYYPSFQPNDLTKEEIYKLVFDRAYDENQMNQLMTKTCRVLENFFAVEGLKKDELLTTKLKRDAFQERQLRKQYSKASKQLQNLLDKKDHPESNTYLERFLLNDNLLYSGNLEQKQKEEYISNCLTHLDQWFVWQKLRLSYLALNESRVKAVNFDLFLLDEILENKTLIDGVGPILKFYEKVIQLQLERDKINTNNLVNWFDEAVESIKYSERREFLVIFLNIMLRRYREGEKDLDTQILEIYKIGLNKGILIRNNSIQPISFVNVVAAALSCEEFEWAKQFIEHYQNYLTNDRINAVNLAYGYLYFSSSENGKDQRNYDLAIKHLLKIESSKSYYQYRLRSLQIRIYYELNQMGGKGFDHVLYFAKSFRRHIKRKSQLNQRKAQAYINFINIVEKLANLHSEDDIKKEKKKLKLMEEINCTERLFASSWILEKIEDIGRK